VLRAQEVQIRTAGPKEATAPQWTHWLEYLMLQLLQSVNAAAMIHLPLVPTNQRHPRCAGLGCIV